MDLIMKNKEKKKAIEHEVMRIESNNKVQLTRVNRGGEEGGRRT